MLFDRAVRRMVRSLLWAALMAAAVPGAALAGQTTVAVAANFTDAAKEIAAAFVAATGHTAVLSFGSTGQLYAQISQEAPFDVFLAADDVRPAKAVEEGFAVAGTDFTYAVGRLVLWSADPALVTGPQMLETAGFDRIAIANPETAPYGAAALETMSALGVRETLQDRIVQGTSIAQTFQFVETGNAELGFVALSQVVARQGGSRWDVPQDFHTPIAQDAVLLTKGAGNEAATAFIDFLKGPEAAALIEAYGYGVESGN